MDYIDNGVTVKIAKRMTMAKNCRFWISLERNNITNIKPSFYELLNISIKYVAPSLVPIIVITPLSKINVEQNTILATFSK